MKQNIPTPVVIVIILVILGVVAGFYFKSTEIKPIHMWTKEEAQRKLAESAKKIKAEKGNAPVVPAPPEATKP